MCKKYLSCLCLTLSFAVSGGLCNLCLDKTNKDYILEANGVEPIINCLSSSNEETVMSAVTTLMYLTTPQSCQQTTALPVVECMLRFSLSASRRLSNLATVFLEDYCTPLQVEEAQNLSKHTAVGIPLPKDWRHQSIWELLMGRPPSVFPCLHFLLSRSRAWWEQRTGKLVRLVLDCRN